MSGASRLNAADGRAQEPTSRRHDFDLLFRREAPRLVRYFRQRTGSPTDALDLAQEAFARMLRVPATTEVASPARYLQRIARNLLFDRSKALPTPLPLEDVEDIGSRPEQEDGICCRDIIARYEAAVAGLTPRTREVFLLHRRDERTYVQIAGLLGITVGTVEYHISRAIMAIGDALEQG